MTKGNHIKDARLFKYDRASLVVRRSTRKPLHWGVYGALKAVYGGSESGSEVEEVYTVLRKHNAEGIVNQYLKRFTRELENPTPSGCEECLRDATFDETGWWVCDCGLTHHTTDLIHQPLTEED